MTAQIFHIRDYRRREEKLEKLAAEILAEVDTSPSEIVPFGGEGLDGIPYQSHNDAILERLHGVPANIGPPNIYDPGYPINYTAPDKDPA